MAVDIDHTWRIRDASNALVIDLNENGYSVVTSSEEDETWDRVTSVSAWVDGDAEAHATKAASVRSLVVSIRAATWPELEAKRLALRAATTQREWLLEQMTMGVSTIWRAGRSDSSSAITAMDMNARRRLVSLRIPVQPGPTIAGLPEEP